MHKFKHIHNKRDIRVRWLKIFSQKQIIGSRLKSFRSGLWCVLQQFSSIKSENWKLDKKITGTSLHSFYWASVTPYKERSCWHKLHVRDKKNTGSIGAWIGKKFFTQKYTGGEELYAGHKDFWRRKRELLERGKKYSLNIGFQVGLLLLLHLL